MPDLVLGSGRAPHPSCGLMNTRSAAVSFGVGLSLPDRPAFAFQAFGVEEEAEAPGGLNYFPAIDWLFARLAEVRSGDFIVRPEASRSYDITLARWVVD